MKLKNLLFLVAIFSLNSWAFSQENTINTNAEEYSISTDRPSASYASSIAPKGILISEIGYFNQLTHYENNLKTSDQTLPNFMFRYGIHDRFELRLGTDFYQNVIKVGTITTKTSGFNPLNVGLKLHVHDEKGAIPQTTFLGQLQLAEAASSFLKLDRNQAFFRFMFQNTLSEKIFVLYNLGMNFNNFDNQYIYTLMLGLIPIDNLTLFLENYGNKSSELSGMDNYAHIGAVYVIQKRYQLDATFGYLITQNKEWNAKSSLFFQLGFSTYLRLCK